MMIRNPINGNALTEDGGYEFIIMSTKLYVGNLSFQTTEGGLRDVFGEFGEVTDVYVASDPNTGRPRGFGFVTFSTEEQSKLATEKLNGADLDGRELTVNEARPKGASAGGRKFDSPNRRAGAFHARGNRRY